MLLEHSIRRKLLRGFNATSLSNDTSSSDQAYTQFFTARNIPENISFLLNEGMENSNGTIFRLVKRNGTVTVEFLSPEFSWGWTYTKIFGRLLYLNHMKNYIKICIKFNNDRFDINYIQNHI